jgi:hypothetical protein
MLCPFCRVSSGVFVFLFLVPPGTPCFCLCFEGSCLCYLWVDFSPVFCVPIDPGTQTMQAKPPLDSSRLGTTLERSNEATTKASGGGYFFLFLRVLRRAAHSKRGRTRLGFSSSLPPIPPFRHPTTLNEAAATPKGRQRPRAVRTDRLDRSRRCSVVLLLLGEGFRQRQEQAGSRLQGSDLGGKGKGGGS